MSDVLVSIILDESGSMESKRNDVIGGFNGFLKEQMEKHGTYRLMVSKFNTIVSPIKWYSSSKKENVSVGELWEFPHLSEKIYNPGGATALYDSVAKTIRDIENVKTKDEKVLCVIMTDGEENSSYEMNADSIGSLLENKKEDGWTFLYIGENPERWRKETGSSFGTSTLYRGIDHGYVTISNCVSTYLSNPDQDTSNLINKITTTLTK